MKNTLNGEKSSKILHISVNSWTIWKKVRSSLFPRYVWLSQKTISRYCPFKASLRLLASLPLLASLLLLMSLLLLDDPTVVFIPSVNVVSVGSCVPAVSVLWCSSCLLYCPSVYLVLSAVMSASLEFLLWLPTVVKGIVSRDEYFVEGPKNRNSTFCWWFS